MRIQHNITAMNSYRNYSANTKAVSKNLEKLSSGYRINRAGDDAAGLAISEKMRAQVTGLETAQKNAKDGISLVQTAEGALTEVHSMLNRMVELADQSANGTYDNETDRANLQKEVTQLKSEINRIADSTNFNGIKLLDGSLDSKGMTGSNKLVLDDLKKGALKTSDGQAGVMTAKAVDPGAVDATTGMPNGYEASYTFSFNNKGVEETHTVKITLASDGTKAKVSVDGGDAKDDASAGTAGTLAAAGKLASGDTAAILKGALSGEDWFKDLDITAAVSGTDLTFTANKVGTDAPNLSGISYSRGAVGAASSNGTVAVSETTKALDKVPQLDLDQMRIAAGADKAIATSKTFEVNGRKFAILDKGNTNTKEALGLTDDVVTIELATGTGVTNADAADAKLVMDEINKIVGSDAFSQQQATDTKLTFNATVGKEGSGTGLTLQIGDTSDSFNKLTVSVGDMHAKSLGIEGLDISTQKGGSDAVQLIKNAINSVSSTRGDLGATQNRLDHTINNLSVMQENIQDAESSIRDVDVAKEMMNYTKNNILVQSAQAMLAQANQLPQGVLQLLG